MIAVTVLIILKIEDKFLRKIVVLNLIEKLWVLEAVK